MKIIIWGTGNYAGTLAFFKGKENILYFVDNNLNRCGQSFLGRKIIHHTEVKNWHDLEVYVPQNYYDEIVPILRGYNVEDSQIKEYGGYYDIDINSAKKDFDRAIEEINRCGNKYKGRVLLFSQVWEFSEYYVKFHEQIAKAVSSEIILVSEAVWNNAEETKRKTGWQSFVVPVFLQYRIGIKGEVGNADSKGVCTLPPKLQEVVHQINAFFPGNEQNAVYEVLCCYSYLDTLLEKLEPVLIVAHSSMLPIHRVLDFVCSEKRIPLLYSHQGIIKGTMSVEPVGMVGKSPVALYYDRFKKLPVEREDIDNAIKCIEYLKKERSNYRTQPKGDISSIRTKVKTGKKTVLLAGTMDSLSWMVPYTKETKEFYSPIFKSSLDAAIYISQICANNDWNFIYKPHGLSPLNEEEISCLKNVIYTENVSIYDLIDISDVVVTITSSVSYLSLIAEKATIMLGYNQLRGKECAYEAYTLEEIEETIVNALENGFTTFQKNSFYTHIAQLLKYYYYDDTSLKDCKFCCRVPLDRKELFFLGELGQDA